MIPTYRYQTTKWGNGSILGIIALHFWLYVNGIWKTLFPLWDSDECEGLLFNVPILLGFNPCDLQNSYGDILKGHSPEDISQSSKYFRGPSFSLFLFNSWVVQNLMKNCYRRLQRWPAPLCSGNWLFPVFILSSQSCNYHFQRCLALPQNREASGMGDFQLASLHYCF